jgi:hypothetical protein
MGRFQHIPQRNGLLPLARCRRRKRSMKRYLQRMQKDSENTFTGEELDGVNRKGPAVDNKSSSDLCEGFFMRDMSDADALKFLENNFALHFTGLELLVLTGICVSEAKCMECFADVHVKLVKQVITQCIFDGVDSPFGLDVLATGSAERNEE